ncbi:hypothetical protein [Melittangium boletus]|uniref:Lipoprotein n=1 Tax=Melittangium boletus DSM 14713 TaxID=1294270 RepID=A0A250ISE8_9BACT|nr:hypothetical protein [Melittangium boletus]ATB34170.1 hypothetical protein MEBOL_007671 [Melittangium boletus DSM 14713]
MKRQGTCVVGAIIWTLLTGCQTPRAVGSGMMSASDSGSGNSSAGSGDSSGASGDSSAGSGESSQASGDSSQSDSGSGDSGQSDSGSGNSSQSDSGSGNSSQSDSGSGNSSQGTSKPTDVSGPLRSSGSSKGARSESAPISSVTTVGATVGGLGVVIWRAFSVAAHAVPPPAAVGQAAQAYLRSRTHQLREDLALGAGPSIDDLAAMARIRRENLRLFGQVLREHRAELLSLAQPSRLTPERALEWLGRVGQLAGAEPRLQEDGSAFLAAQGLME